MTRTITAYFDNRTEAQLACDRLSELGIPASRVNIHDSSSTTTATTSGSEHKGFWASLGDLFIPDEDRHTYSEGIRRGGAVLTVQAEETEFDRVSDILEEAGSVDLDARESEWRSEGWSGTDASVTSTTGMVNAGTSRASSAENLTGREDYIPVAEEQLRVGKREVDHGRVRIRSYVVETPVEEHVSLRNETVNLERNPVNRAATSADNLFQERTIEAEERGEEAVISKEARVVEEVRLNKEVQERDQIVSDTIRRTEVEVDDERAGSALTDAETSRQRRAV